MMLFSFDPSRQELLTVPSQWAEDMGHMAWPLKITMGDLPHLHFGGRHLQVPMPDHYKLHPQNLPFWGGQLLEGETNPLPRHVWSSSGGKARFTTTCKKGTWSRSNSTRNNPFRSPQNPGESCRKQLLGRYLVGIAVGQTSQSPQASISKRKACKRLSLQTWSAKFN